MTLPHPADLAAVRSDRRHRQSRGPVMTPSLPHPDDLKAVCDANRPRLMATADAVRALLDKVKK